MAKQRKRERREDERYCPECGEPVKRAAVVCVYCGVPLRPMAVAGQAVRAGSGLEPRVAATVSYSLTWVTGLIFLPIEPHDEFVRYHARQAIAFGVASVIVWCLVAIFAGIFDHLFYFGRLGGLVWAFFFFGWLITWIVLMVKAYLGERFKLWLLGDLAEEQGTGAAR